jgi:hypothetical protein
VTAVAASCPAPRPDRTGGVGDLFGEAALLGIGERSRAAADPARSEDNTRRAKGRARTIDAHTNGDTGV